MKAVFKETKRIISVLLSMAMILAYVPTASVPVYAATEAGTGSIEVNDTALATAANNVTYTVGAWENDTETNEATAIITAVPDDGYKLDTSAEGLAKLKVTGTCSSATFEDVDSFGVDGTAVVATATIIGTNNTETLTLKNSTESGAATEILNKVAVAGTTGLTVTYSTDGSIYSNTNPYADGLAVSALTNLFIKVAAPEGEEFSGAVTAATSGDGANTGAFEGTPAAGDTEVIYKLEDSSFTTTGNADITTTVTFSNTGVSYFTGAITITDGTHADVAVYNGETEISTGGSADLGTSETGTLTVFVNPNTDYVSPLPAVSVKQGTTDVEITAVDGDATAFNGRDESTAYTFTAEKGKTYTITAAGDFDAKAKPIYNRSDSLTEFTLKNSNGDTITSSNKVFDIEGPANFTIVRKDSTVEVDSVTVTVSGVHTNTLTPELGGTEANRTFTISVPDNALGDTYAIAISKKNAESAIKIKEGSTGTITGIVGSNLSKTYTAQKKDTNGDWKDYTDVTWTLKDSKGNTATIPDGLTVNDSTGVYKISGRPTASTNGDVDYTLVAIDNATSGKTAEIGLAYTISDIAGDIYVKGGNQTSSAQLTSITAGVIVTFTDDEDKYTQTYTVTNKNSDKTITIDDISLDTDGANNFEIVSGGGSTTIGPLDEKEITIRPKSTLTPSDTPYDGALLITSKMFIGNSGYNVEDDDEGILKLADLTYTKGGSITINVNGTAAIETPASAVATTGEVTKHTSIFGEIDLGTVEVGKQIDNLVFTSTSDYSGVKFVIDETKFPAGLERTANGASVTISGTPTQAAFDASITDTAWTASLDKIKETTDAGKTVISYAIPVTVTYGSETKNYVGILKVAPSSKVVYAASNVEKTEVEGVLTYSWTGKEGASADSLKRTVTVTNNGTKELKLNAAIAATTGTLKYEGSGAQTLASTTAPGAKDFTLKAGEAESFAIDPDGASAIGTLTITGQASQGIETKVINLKYTHVNGLTVTNMTGDGSSTTPYDMGEFPLGSYMSFSIITDTTNTSAGAVAWNWGTGSSSITATTPSGTFAVKSSDDALKNDTGLTLSATGTMSGIPKAKGKYALVLTAKEGNTTSSIVNKYFVFEIGAATESLALYADNTIISETTGLQNFENTIDGDEIAKTITIKNNSTIPVAAAMTVNVYADAAGSSAYSGGYFSVADLSAASIDAGKSVTFTLKAGTKSGTATGAAGDKAFVVVKDTAGDVMFSFPVKVVVNQVPKITTTGTAYGSVSWTTTVDSLPTLVLGTMGTEIKVDNAIQLKGMSVDGTTQYKPEAADGKDPIWSWKKTADAPNSHDIANSGLTLTEGGKIYGTPTEAGVFYTTLDVVGKDDATSTHGTKDVVFVINGQGSVSLYDGTTNLSGAIKKFAGGYVGGKAPVALSVNVKNTGAVDLSALTVSITDDPTKMTIGGIETAVYAGSAEKFAIDTTSIAELEKGDTTVVRIQPKDLTTAGTYRAVVTVSGAQITDMSFKVQFTVAEPVGINTPEAAAMAGAIGGAWEYQLVSTGAGKAVGTNTEGYTATKDINEQEVEWYLVADTTATLSEKVTELTGTAGITSTIAGGNTDFETPLGKTAYRYGRKITGGLLKATSLGKVGTYNFVIRAYTPAVTASNVSTFEGKSGAATCAQYKDISLTLTVFATGRVYASAMTDDHGEVTTVKERSFDKSGAKVEEVSAYKFNELPLGGYTATAITETITIKNLATAAMAVKAEFKNKDGSDNEDFAFVGAVTKNVPTNGVQTWEIRPAKDDLAEGTYEADLTFSGTDFTTITIPVSVTVAEQKYDFSLLDDKTEVGSSLDLGTLVKDKTPTAKTLKVKNTGNMELDVDVVEVMDENGTEFGSNPDYKFSSVSFAGGNPIPVNDSDRTIKFTPAKTTTAGTYTGYIRVRGKKKSTTTVVKTTILKVDYTVLNNNVTGVTITPETVSIDNATEGYKSTDFENVLSFTVSNGEMSDSELNALSNVTIKLEGANVDQFEIVGAVKKTDDKGKAIAWGADSLARGAQLPFSIQPKEGMVDTSAGTGTIYSAQVVVTADNYSGTIRVPVLFKVGASDSVVLYASTEGEDVNASISSRLAATLAGIATTDTKVLKDAPTYYINLNGTASATDYDFAFNATTKKLTKGAKCNVNVYENTLSYATGSAGASFKTVEIRLLDTVKVDLSDGSIKMLNSEGKEDTVANVLGKDTFVYKVPYGKTLKDAIKISSNDDTFEAWPAVYYAGYARSLKGWWYNNTDGTHGSFTEVMALRNDYDSVTPDWHVHKYPMETDDHVKFDWTTWEADHSVVSIPVTVDCIGEDGESCVNPAEGQLKLTATITKLSVGATHTTEGGESYVASVINPINSVTYTDSKIPEPTAPVGHEWEYDYASAAFNADFTEATITRTCKNSDGKHDPAKDGPLTETLTTTEITATPDEDVSCIKKGGVTYTAIFKDENGETVKDAEGKDFVLTAKLDEKFGPHTYKFFVEWNDDHETVKSAKLVCSVCTAETEGHEVDVLSAVSYNRVPATGTIQSNQAKVTYKGVTYESEVWTSHTDHKWSYTSMDWSAYNFTTPEVAQTNTVVATFTCSVGGETDTTNADVVVKSQAVKATKTELGWTVYMYTATAKNPAGQADKNAVETVYKKFQGGAWQDATKDDWKKAASAAGSGDDSPSEPADSSSYNLFYKDQDISIALPDGIKLDSKGNVDGGTAKWTGFFTIDGSGNVTVTGDRKNAAKAANSLIVAPILDSEDNVIGEFEYSLPVSYQKPSLKLTSTSGTIKAGTEQTLTTFVTEKKSSSAYEPLELSDGDVKYVASKGSASAVAGVEVGEVNIKASAAASGKITVQPDNWNEPVGLSYSVKAVTKDVLTVSAKQVILNENAVEKTAQTVHLQLNNADISESDGVVVDLPRNWSSSGVLFSEGVSSDNKVESSDITFSYGSSVKKGTYTLTFKKGNSKATLKVVVSNKTLDNSVSFTVKSKINAVTGQKMVLEPKYVGLNGPIADDGVEFTTLDDTYEIDWDAARGTVIIGVAEGKTVSKGDFDKTLKVTVAGETCNVRVKTKIVETKPTVKIDKLTLPKDAFKAGTAAGSSRLNATYKLGGKTFVIAPDKVTFTDGKPADSIGTDWYLIEGSNVAVHWNEDDGVIEVQSVKNSDGKTKNVKVEAKFGSTTIKKSLTLKAK